MTDSYAVRSAASFKEGDSTLPALVGHDLHESKARSIVDADVDELPTDAVVTVDHARMSSSDATYGADPAELLDVDVDELARVLALIASNGFSRL